MLAEGSRNMTEINRNMHPSDAKYSGNIIASYFGGEIKEKEHRNDFLYRGMFETWGKKPLSEERHFLVNGYANAWLIKPEDVGGRTSYRLIVEFWPQRLFYIGLGISGLTLVGCLGYLVVNKVKCVPRSGTKYNRNTIEIQ